MAQTAGSSGRAHATESFHIVSTDQAPGNQGDKPSRVPCPTDTQGPIGQKNPQQGERGAVDRHPIGSRKAKPTIVEVRQRSSEEGRVINTTPSESRRNHKGADKASAHRGADTEGGTAWGRTPEADMASVHKPWAQACTW
jgi:hypothetical protein